MKSLIDKESLSISVRGHNVVKRLDMSPYRPSLELDLP